MSVMRSSLLVIVVAAACGGSSARTGDDGPDPGPDAGTASLMCSTALSCPAPSSGTKQTVCGQLFDLETSATFGETSVGVTCTSPTTSGPCSLAIEAYDAIAFASNPTFAAPLPHGAIEIDSCGRYRITDIDVTGIGPFIGLAIDDAAGRGVTGTTVTTFISTSKIVGAATDGLEAWIVREATTTQWAASGGPALAGGVYVPLFRAHKLATPQTDPFEPQPGVQVTRNGTPIPQYYFASELLDRTTIDTQAVTTGANGSALIINAAIHDGVAYGGSGGLDASVCRWEPHVGMALSNIVAVQIFRPLDVIGYQCPL